MSVEFVGIELELRGADKVEGDLKQIDSLLNSLGGRKQVKSGLAELQKEIVKARGELEKFQRLRQQYLDAGGKGDAFTEEIKDARNHLKDLQQAQREVQASTKNLGRTFKQEFNAISSSVAHIGSAMQSLGNAMVRLTSPIRRITSGFLMGVGYKALNMFTEGLGGAFERYDVMKNYSRTLEAFGFSAEQAQASVEKLNESVLGLPTGLDEIVAAQKVYVGATNDLDKATDIAIAANNTFLASGMGSREQRFMQKYLVALGSGAKLAATQWDSMARIAPMAMRAVATELGYADEDYQQFTKDVKNGTVAGEEFLKAFIKVGSEGKIADAANVMKMSFEGLSANIQNAAKRMGEGIIKSLDEVFQGYSGRTLLQRLLGVDAEGHDMGDGIKHWIDDLSLSIQNWIKSHPEEITDFFETLKSIDWKGLLKGVGEGMLEVLDLFKKFADWLSDKDMSKVGKFAVWANIVGNGLLVIGGALKGTRHIWGFLGTLLLRKSGGLLGGKGGGLFGKLIGIFGKKKDIVDAGEAAKEIPTVADSFRGAFNALQGLIKAAGAVIIVTGTGAFAFKAVKSMIKDLKDIGDELKGMTWLDAVTGANIVLSIGVMTKVFEALGTALGTNGLLYTAIAGAASFIVAGSFAADMWAVKTGLQQLRDTITTFDEVASAIDNMQGFTDFATAKQKISDMVDSISEIVTLFQGQSANHIEGIERTPGLKRLGRGKVNTVENLAKALDGMKSAVEKLNQLASMGIAANAKSKAHMIMDTIKAVMDEFSGLTWMTSPTSNLNKNAENLADALIGIRRVAYHINKLAATDVDTGGFASFVQQIKTALEELKGIEGDLILDVEVKLAPEFKTSVDKVIKKINDARNKIAQEQNTAINVSIPVNVKFNVSTNVGTAVSAITRGAAAIRAAVPRFPAKGGMIYRAKGGDVAWKRRGTDTVPAMLTPGEYVHNKRAVDMFGIDFMRKVNNLDMKGAMNELMHRAGGMANINRGTTITNNTYNNQKATINVTTNSAEFTGRLASRFVGAF